MSGRRAVLAGLAGLFAARGVGRAAPRPLRVAFEPALATSTVLLLAQALGFLAEAGVAVTRVPVGGGPDLAAVLRRGDADAAIGPALSLLPPLQAGLPARLLAGVAGGGLRLLAMPHSRIRHIEDVAGRRIGVDQLDGAAKLFFSIMMRRKGVDPFRRVTWVEVATASQTAALADGAVDAVAAADPAGWILRTTMRLTEVATDLSGSYRERAGVVLAAGDRLLADDAGQAGALAAALLRAAAALARDPAAAAAIAAPLAPTLTDAERAAMLRAETQRQHPTGHALRDDIAAYADELRLVGLFPYGLNAAAFAASVCHGLPSAG